MTIILDTNAVSEAMKADSDPVFARWLKSQPPSSLYLSTITEAELRFGVAILPPGRRRASLSIDVEAVIAEDFAGRVLTFDSPAAVEYAAIMAERRRAGRPTSIPDAQIAAIGKCRGASVATRNIKDFEGCGVVLINPWDESA